MAGTTSEVVPFVGGLGILFLDIDAAGGVYEDHP